MAIRFNCQSCGHSYHVRAAFAGTCWACRGCGAQIEVPQQTPATPVESQTSEGHWSGEFMPCGLPTRHYRVHNKAEFDHPTLPDDGRRRVESEADDRSYRERLAAWERLDSRRRGR